MKINEKTTNEAMQYSKHNTTGIFTIWQNKTKTHEQTKSETKTNSKEWRLFYTIIYENRIQPPDMYNALGGLFSIWYSNSTKDWYLLLIRTDRHVVRMLYAYYVNANNIIL